MNSDRARQIETDEKSIKSYQLKVEKKEPGAALSLGLLYANGSLGEPNIKKGWELILREFELNNEYRSLAALSLGVLVAAENLTEACYWLLIAAKIPSPVDKQAFTNLQQLKAMFPTEACVMETLAICWDCGYGTIKDKKEAYRLFRNAQIVGSSTANFCLGISYETGMEPVVKDFASAKSVYKKFAEKNPRHPYARLFARNQECKQPTDALLFSKKFD